MTLWGFADLHAHPACHLGFGANAEGTGGIMWGKPGLRLEDVERTLPSDLAPCIPDKHSGFDEDIVRHETRKTIIGSINQITGHSHISSGWPNFEGWPHAQSVLHQQMHVSWIHRAWQGGLRLMFASVTENQTLSMLWHRGFNLLGSQPKADPTVEMESARRQITFIRNMAQANSTWMEIAETPDQARNAISRGKLALILSLEMDSLNAEQILTLKREYGIRHVIPIHLANNSFGGVAIYSDLFNTHNYYLNERFYQVTGDPNLEFRLARPEYPAVDLAGSVKPKKIEQTEYQTLGYECFPGGSVPCVPTNQGHKNPQGLIRAELEKLMREGILLDLAHMSDASQNDAIALAERFNYPVMNSHTGLRRDGQRATSERSMRRSLAERMARLGGVLGLGTEGTPRGSILFSQNRSSSAPVVRFTGEQPEWQVNLQRSSASDTLVTRLRVTLRTGSDDLRGGSQAYALVGFGSRGRQEFPLNNGAGWGNGSVNTATYDLPNGTRLRDIQLFGIRYVSGRSDVFSTTDNWNLDELQVDYETVITLVNLTGGPIMRFTGDRRVWSTPIARSENMTVQRLQITLRTGGDDLRTNSQAIALINLRDGRELSFPLNEGRSWGNGSVNTRTITLPDNVRLSDITAFGIRHVSGQTNPFDSYDNWNLDAVRVDYEGVRGSLFRSAGRPLARFTGEQPERIFYTTAAGSEDVLADRLRVTIQTGGDDLRTNSQAYAIVGLERNQRLEFPLNRGANWGNDSTYKAILTLPNGTRRSQILLFGIRYVSGSSSITDTTDNWSVDRVHVEILQDPVAQWVTEYLDANEVMQNRGVALGTDINGYAPQVPFSRQTVVYPINVATRFAAPGTTPPSLDRCRVGNKTFDFTNDGIAHYGMLPDFLQAASQHSDRVGLLFRTAEDVIQMWERVENAARALNGSDSPSSGTAIRGWVWADQPSAANYTPSPSYQHNSRGGINQISRLGTGQYQVSLPQLGTTGGMVHVSAYGGSHYCKVVGWGASGSTQQIWVNCFSANGQPIDGRFVLLFYQESRSTPGSDAYLWANQPSIASYTPDPAYQWNARGLANTVRRISPGRYQVTLLGLNALGGTVMVTAYGTGNERCKVGGWYPSGGDTVVDVHGFDAAGNPADTRFTLSFITDVGLGDGITGNQPYGGFVWANEAAAAAYTPDMTYQKNTAGGSNTISRTAIGSYVVRFPALAPSNSTTALVTAYGSSSDYCTIQGWGSDGNSGTNITVRCFNSTGTPVDTQFTLLYLTDDPM